MPPVVATEGPDVTSRRDSNREPDARDDVDEEDDAREENSEDEVWEIGRSIWGLGPVPPDWDSEDEV